MTLAMDHGFHMWVILAATAAAVVFFVREKVPLEITSIALLTGLLLFGQLFPLEDANGRNYLDATSLLAGFANPSLIAVLALLVMGQAMIHTDVLRFATGLITAGNKQNAWISILAILLFVMVVSAVMNNTPLVIIAIPLLQALANSVGISESRVMIPLSYVAILGGMTTLIGSSTNLLVASAMAELGYQPLRFFDFIVPGSIMAAVGFLYVAFVVPRFLPDRSSITQELAGGNKEFIAELDIAGDSKLIGAECMEGRFAELGDLRVKMIQRGGHLILPPFEGYMIEAGDILIVAATRKALMEILLKYPGFLLTDEDVEIMDGKASGDEDDSAENVQKAESETRILAEIMITPASRLVDVLLDQAGFDRQFGAVVLGIQRRAQMLRRRLGRIRLEPGDVLLVAGRRATIDALQNNADFIVLSGSKRELPMPDKAPLASGIFVGAIGLAAVGVLSIPVAAIVGAVTMIATGCLNVRQAMRALDRKIFLLVGTMLALGTALQVSGGARYLAELILKLPFVDTPLVMIAFLFLLIAFITNIVTNNACAILFTPIALNLAGSVQVPAALPYDIAFIFAITVVFASNCSFASPIGYQTNLLVMGPGHYRFRDFTKSGIPLVGLLCITYILIVKYYFGL